MERLSAWCMKLRLVIYMGMLLCFLLFLASAYHARLIRMLAAVIQYVPDEKKIEALQHAKTNTAHTALLNTLGYTDNGTALLLIVCVWGVFFLAIYFLESHFLKKRIQSEKGHITAYLNALEKGTAPLIPRPAEKDILYDKLYKLYTELLTTREQAQDEKRLFQKNLEDIAHQIKTPLTAMLLSCDNAVQKDAPVFDHAGAAALVKNLNRLDELTDRLLHAASLEAGCQTMRMSRFSVFEACLEAYEHCEHLFKQHGIAVHIEPSPAFIHADYYWITEAFMNVFKNAASYLAKGNRVYVSFAETPLYVQAVFKDDGAGIAKEALRFLFDRFYKTPDSQGFGLGLHIAKSIAEKNNGALYAYNEHGAAFQFTFYKEN